MSPFCSCGPQADGRLSTPVQFNFDNILLLDQLCQLENVAALARKHRHLPPSPKAFPLTQEVWVASHSARLCPMTRTHAQTLVEMLVNTKIRRIELVTCRSNAKSTSFSIKASVFYAGCLGVSSKPSKT